MMIQHVSLPTGRTIAGAFLFLAALTSARATPAQCAQWLPGSGPPGVGSNNAGSVDCVLPWDPDGAGPAPPQLIVGGTFGFAGTSAVNQIASYDPATATWAPLGSGVSLGATAFAYVEGLATLPNGDLAVGGLFTDAGGAPAQNIAAWNGSAWSTLGSGIAGRVHHLTNLANGDLVAAGVFTSAGGVAAVNVARWDGAAWHAMGGGVPLPLNSRIAAVLPLANGDLLVTTPADIKRWNGTSWSPLPGSGPYVSAMTGLPNGDVLVASFGFAGTLLMRWNGASWAIETSGWNGGIDRLLTLPGGQVVVCGRFSQVGAMAASGIAVGSGASWSGLATGLASGSLVRGLAVLNGDLYVGGAIWAAGGQGVGHVARWNGAAWSALNPGTDAGIATMVEMPDGSLVAGGSFLTIEGVQARNVARWNGTTWSPLGAGLQGYVVQVAARPDGSIVAATSVVGGMCVATWNGASWSNSSPVNSTIHALEVLPNGDVVAGGGFNNAGGTPVQNIARWNGSAWSPLGSGCNSSVRALCRLANGDLIAGGLFSSAGGTPASCVARWDGTAWFPLGSGTGLAVDEVVQHPNGDVLVAGEFTVAGGAPAQGIARWNGNGWAPLGGGLVNPGHVVTHVRLTVLPDGDVVAAGEFYVAGGQPANRIARWDGSAWSALGSGTDVTPATVLALDAGVLAFGGGFHIAGGVMSKGFARYASTCPASAVPSGAGCASSAGPGVLTPTSRPWLGATYRAAAHGLPALSLAVEVLGLAPVSVPLAAILPQGGAGCTLHVAPDVLLMHVPVAGSVRTAYAVPDSPVFLGFVFHQQIAVLEFAASGLLALTSTNALACTKGMF
ncbi:MAG TPA: hypothetical protein VF384_09025 [Planctomycetota bacterium]